jgi:hypothetical protein
VQALLASQLRLYLGARVRGTPPANAERFAAIALLALGLYLLINPLTG